MGKLDEGEVPETVPLNRPRLGSTASHSSSDSGLSIASAAFIDAHKGEFAAAGGEDQRYRDLEDGAEPESDEPFLHSATTKTRAVSGRRWCLLGLLVCVVMASGWIVAFVAFLVQGRNPAAAVSSHSQIEVHEPDSATGGTSYGKPVTLKQVLMGQWLPQSHAIAWTAGPNGEDGLLIEQGEDKDGYLRIEDIRDRKDGSDGSNAKVLMKTSRFLVGTTPVTASRIWVSPNHEKVLVLSDYKSNWRHSYYGNYWIFDVATQTAEALDPENHTGRIQLAWWSPESDAVVFVWENNVYLRKLSSAKAIPITTDGGKDVFNGVPDWVYEEEVLSGNGATWWSLDGKFIAMLRTNETDVPEYPVQYFLHRPSGTSPPAGLENYPEVRQIKYPKAGAPNPIVNLRFYDVEKDELFTIVMPEDFVDNDRIIIEVVWAPGNKVLIRETNRESDVVKIFLVDAQSRSAKLVRSTDIAALDGGWVEPSQSTWVIPADPENGRPDPGYVDTVVHDGFDHLAYFSPLDSSEPVMLTSGHWEVVQAPTSVDLKKGLVYFVGTKEGPTQRHVYQIKLDGSDLRALTDTSKPGYYDVSFSDGAGYALLSYKGPAVPWQAVVSTGDNKMTKEIIIEENKELTQQVKDFALPAEVYSTVTIDGFELQVVERRPPHFNPKKKYPVLFHLYGGPGSQTVDRKFTVDFQAYVASSLGYIVVTVDGRGTGFIGRKARCIVRDNLGYYEARDQIETAKIWRKKPYVDETRLAIWGWSFGGFMTLKVLEQDAGETFQYGMAVAPVTDWRYYDSIYTERYMHKPQNNPEGYSNSTISDITALGENTRFLIMHGVADDNVHYQNTLTLLDRMNLQNIDNWDMVMFPDSDHSIYFHNAHTVVYERLSSWLINAFNGEWHRIANPTPVESSWKLAKRVFSHAFSFAS
ncbi:putative dipeptidyl-aminopeptidase B [Penicillium oxalicum]|uniref:dipeptidyl-peptidase IV n=1 Tax=Penicillium oxalicum TaxID=69781 RepID=A0A1X9Q212_PENOX|nr:putative dipeptidyl-aminopeptidase B [Penicillium oxalicum]ARQ16400.1 dipeptidyl aminopeptidase type IV [Penicillium oxalicum]KAI2786604.1 putative dipeptidyl-aminopeptidase B [Penicillium oxalicum]